MFTIRFRRGTAQRWTEVNPVLNEAEPGFELNTGKLKVGDGHTAWNDLSYLAPSEWSDGQQDAMAALITHENSLTPHPIYDDGPSLSLLYENAKV